MAKRKRLEVPADVSPDLETKSTFPPRARMPIADVAGDTAGRAALEEVAREMTLAESEGRIAKKLPLDQIEVQHMCRDRLVLDEDDMAALVASIRERGQQTPIEVVRLSDGKFGLISGLRRVEALRALESSHVLALVKKPESSQAAYQAMVEENEIRAPLSFYERANIAVTSVGQGVYPNPKKAITGLFAHATPAKRSKIAKFLVIRDALGKALHFPAAIPEKLGLALAQAIEADPRLSTRIKDALRKTPPADAAGERRTLERLLRKQDLPVARAPEALAPGLRASFKAGRVVLTGDALTDELYADLRDFLISRAKSKG
jgi:ParB family chromosome partitioning protein